jgi:hypothetical protein
MKFMSLLIAGIRIVYVFLKLNLVSAKPYLTLRLYKQRHLKLNSNHFYYEYNKCRFII